MRRPIWIALAVVVAPVERQKARVAERQLAGHVNEVGVDSEVHYRSFTEQRVDRIAVGLVLLDRVANPLAGERVLQLSGGKATGIPLTNRQRSSSLSCRG